MKIYKISSNTGLLAKTYWIHIYWLLLTKTHKIWSTMDHLTKIQCFIVHYIIKKLDFFGFATNNLKEFHLFTPLDENLQTFHLLRSLQQKAKIFIDFGPFCPKINFLVSIESLQQKPTKTLSLMNPKMETSKGSLLINRPPSFHENFMPHWP